MSFNLVASLLSCLYQLKSENVNLEEELATCSRRRDHLLAVNARLAIPLPPQSNFLFYILFKNIDLKYVVGAQPIYNVYCIFKIIETVYQSQLVITTLKLYPCNNQDQTISPIPEILILHYNTDIKTIQCLIGIFIFFTG